MLKKQKKTIPSDASTPDHRVLDRIASAGASTKALIEQHNIISFGVRTSKFP